MVKKKSVNLKKKVGIVQLVFGIILMIASIIAFFIVPNYFEAKQFEFVQDSAGGEWSQVWANSSSEIRAIGELSFANYAYDYLYYASILKTIILCMIVLSTILSVMFILNGLVNLKE